MKRMLVVLLALSSAACGSGGGGGASGGWSRFRANESSTGFIADHTAGNGGAAVACT